MYYYKNENGDLFALFEKPIKHEQEVTEDNMVVFKVVPDDNYTEITQEEYNEARKRSK